MTTAMACLAVVLLGSVSFGELAVDLLPDVSTPRITLLVRAPSLAPPEVERLVTVPLEQAVSTVAGIDGSSSVSREGLSVVTVTFPWGVDLDLAALHVREAVDRSLERLPEGAERPAVLRWDPGSEPIMGVAVAGDDDPGALRELAASIIGPRLEQAAGVAGARITGGAEREIEVRIDPRKLALHGLTVADVDQALRAANVSLPGGSVLRGDHRYTVRAVGEFQTPREIADVPVRTPTGAASGSRGGRSGGLAAASSPPPRTGIRRSSGAGRGGGRGSATPLVRLRDLGSVTVGTRGREAGALLDGRPAVGVLLYKEAGSNTVGAVARAREAVDDLRDQYPGLSLEIAFESASFIEDAIASVVQNIALGGLLAFGVLFLFLRDLRNPVLLGVSIPVSIIATFVLCYFAGISLNIMTLGGLALGVGMLVDNSIVVLENIFRHREGGLGPSASAVEGTEEVAMAVTASTLTTIAVFLPVAYVHGLAGQLFAAQVWTVTFALLASLAVSLTLLPMLASRFLRLGDRAVGSGGAVGGNGAASEAGGAGARRYHSVLGWCLEHKGWSLVILALLLALGARVAWALPWELMPPVDSGRFEVDVEAPAGTPFETLEGRIADLDRAVREIDGVDSTFATVGVEAATAPGAAAGALEMAPNRAHMRVVLVPEERRPEGALEEAMATVRRSAREGGMTVVIDPRRTPLQRLLGLEDSGFRVRVAGSELERLETLAGVVADALRPLEGLEDVTAGVARGSPEIRLRVRRDAAARYGVPVEAVTRSLVAALQGTLTTQFAEFDRRIEIRIAARTSEADLDAVFDTTYPAPGGPVPFRELVDADAAVGPTEIHRVERTRVIPVTATLDGIRLSEAVDRVESALADVERPEGYRLRVAGERRQVQASFRSVARALGLATLLVYMVMAAQFESIRHPFAIMLTLPLGWVGVVVGLAVTGQSLNVVALIGAVVLTGIVVNDGIVKIDTINRLRRDGAGRRAAVLRGSELRLRPILMTTLTTMIGLLPLALGLGAGSELQRPLAVAVIGGELTGTILTLVAIPLAYELLDGLGRG